MRHTAKKIKTGLQPYWTGYRAWDYRGYIIKTSRNTGCWITETPNGKKFTSLTKKQAKQAIDNILDN
jgi:intein/homing endonuclease